MTVIADMQCFVKTSSGITYNNREIDTKELRLCKKANSVTLNAELVNCFQPPSPQTRSISTPQKLHSEMSPQTHSQAVHGIPQIHKIKAIVSMG